MNPRSILEFFHSRGAMVLAMLMLTVATCVAYSSGVVEALPGNRGLLLPSANQWFDAGEGSLIANLLVLAGLTMAISLLDKGYNLMRSLTSLWGTGFVLLLLPVPLLAGQFYGGTLLCGAMILIMALMFSTYAQSHPQRRIFLMFFILSVCMLFQYAFMFYMLISLAGLAQMRVMNLKSLTAAAIGIITPPWILIGSGIVSADAIHWPQFVNTLSELDKPEMIQMFCAVGVTIVGGIVFLSLNLLKILSYNAKMRACNGFISLVMCCTILLIFIDWINFWIYVPLLCMSVAFQISMYFTNNRRRLSYIPLAGIVLLNIALYVWALVI